MTSQEFGARTVPGVGTKGTSPSANNGNANVLARTAKTPLSEQGDVKEEGIDLLVMPDD